MKPEKMTAVFMGKNNLASKFWLFRFKPSNKFHFLAGQYLSMKVADDGARRIYSIYNPPGREVIELLVDTSPGGLGTKYLMGLKIRDEIEIFGPAGKFVVTSDRDVMTSEKLLFMATGSGVAPIRSIIIDLLENKKETREITLLWGLRYKEDIFGVEELKKLAINYRNFKYELVLSRPTAEWDGLCGHITDRLVLDRSISDTKVYLCGRSGMIDDAVKIMVERGVSQDHIYSERYL